MNFEHISVLLNECIESLNIKKNGVYIDGTMGGAGHSSHIAKALENTGNLICIDQDENAIKVGKKRLAGFNNITFVHSNFSKIQEIYSSLNMSDVGVDGILLDLGVSSHQLDEGYRGFSYMQDAPLDMRMDIRNDFSAYTVVNTYSKEELNKIISQYGEERWSKRIAEFIENERKIKPIETTFELVSIIKKAIPKGARIDGPHPAKRTFQAIRIEVNGELEILKDTITSMVNILNKNGRLLIITFHSLEDRIVKNVFKELENPCICPRDLPICACGKKSLGRVVTRKPILPSEYELEQNHRSRSAKLRVFERR
ncbi:16S rRNA (cytosine(1402)-N(4))-methyltransferase RsmH [uncultured Tyzzerella sp.]|uniref:16S rRNA (cytosine(1402)-N(4))-methyltransferase RsmH n=1 Tax=uncultured Tyzzerella sp. TaxID=2321398 RepID=UPI002941E0AD|nr:16S rRNA (cytosine(1402)-N(4))-methyltransferase RsmH [uncultured Tyzzerella sp.]